MSEIRFFHADRDRFGWLSNFYPSPLPDQNGQVWPTVEHAFQAMKTLDPVERERILLAETPGMAKRLGRQVALRPGWDSLRIEVMRRLLAVKFAPGSELAARLIRTGNAVLIEDSPTDYFWGCGRTGKGENRLGELLEERRDQLQDAQADGFAANLRDLYRKDAP